jgi:hypothetical protein
MNTRLRTTIAALALIGAGYVAGHVTPAGAYTQDETRLMNQVVTELRGIKNELAQISKKLR